MDRRWLIKSLLASGAALSCGYPALSIEGLSSFVLANGLRVTFVRSPSAFVNATLILRSGLIYDDGGLGHIVEHTSFVGAAGDWSAEAVKNAQQDVIQEINAHTQPGMIRWDACFLPDNLTSAIELLAITSLDQKFDVETVTSEARIVLQELYLDKYSPTVQAERQMSVALCGATHPAAHDTTPHEIAKASIAPARLAAELKDYASRIRLPGNMELFVAGNIDPDALRRAATKNFGRYAAASGPMLQMPPVATTRAFKALRGTSGELNAPLSQLRLAWNTGVRIVDKDAGIVVALADYVNRKLMKALREEYGDSYTPEATYDPDSCSGIFRISVDTSTDTAKVERRVIDTFDKLKREVDAKELARFRAHLELKRRRNEQNNEATIDRLVDRVAEGASKFDLRPEQVTAEELIGAARAYLPKFREGYVKLVLAGQRGAQVASTRRR